ncbi:MAG: inositol monophosphatase family protein, partial [Bacteroidales bacterium]|nr:inositol monophosphatase family protein [Bacteroidales bacterium]
MNSIQLEKLTHDVCGLAKATGVFIKKQLEGDRQLDIQEKGSHDFVTRVDKLAEQMLVAGLKKLLPDSGFLAEEDTANTSQKQYMWIVDPLDGTTNYIHAVPLFSISIALICSNELIIGVIYEINLEECFYTWKGSPAYMNGKQISTSSLSNLDHSLFATGFPYYDYSRMEPYMKVFDHLMQHSSGLRRLGSAAVDLAYVACGRFEGFYEYGLHPWDVAAGALLVQQAGGKVSDFKGGNDYLYGGEIVATNDPVHQHLM